MLPSLQSANLNATPARFGHAPALRPKCTSSIGDDVCFGAWGGQPERLVGKRRTDGSIQWVPESQAMRDVEKMGRWDSGKRDGGGPDRDDEELVEKVRRWGRQVKDALLGGG